MFQRLLARLHQEESGFTLIELMVVVLIIGILIAIAIPTFLGARGRAEDRAAQSNLRNTLVSAKVIFSDNEDYTKVTTGAGGTLTVAEPSLTFVANGVASTVATPSISVKGATATTFYAAEMSHTGTCWYIYDNTGSTAPSGTMWGKSTTAANCTADAANTSVALFTNATRSPGTAAALP